MIPQNRAAYNQNRRAYTPSYNSPRMSTRPQYNNSRIGNNIFTDRRSTITLQRRTQSRTYSAPSRTNYSEYTYLFSTK